MPEKEKLVNHVSFY